MNRWWSRVAAALLLLAIVIAAVLAVSLYALPLDGTTVTVDGETFSLANISASQAVAAFAVAVVATVAGLIVAAVAIAFALLVAALGIGIGILATVASLALVASPFLLVGWLVWRAVRAPRQASAPPTAPA
jgi:hypothetical protein